MNLYNKKKTQPLFALLLMGFQLINITGNLALYVNFWSLRVSLKSNTQKAKTMNGYLNTLYATTNP